MDSGTLPAFRAPPPDRRSAMMAKAHELEATFLAQMLGHAELGKVSSEFGGGPGEEHFASFLNQEHARLMVGKGGIGLAELIFNSMDRASDDHGA